MQNSKKSKQDKKNAVLGANRIFAYRPKTDDTSGKPTSLLKGGDRY